MFLFRKQLTEKLMEAFQVKLKWKTEKKIPS